MTKKKATKVDSSPRTDAEGAPLENYWLDLCSEHTSRFHGPHSFAAEAGKVCGITGCLGAAKISTIQWRRKQEAVSLADRWDDK